MFEYTCSAHCIKCSFLKNPVYAFKWEDVVTFLTKFRGFDYEITKVSFQNAEWAENLLDTHLVGATFIIDGVITDLSNCDSESKEYNNVRNKIDALFECETQVECS